MNDATEEARRAAIYAVEIEPRLQRLAKVCEEYGVPFYAVVELGPVSHRTVKFIPPTTTGEMLFVGARLPQPPATPAPSRPTFRLLKGGRDDA